MEYFKISLLLIILTNGLCSENRIRRQSDSTTEVVGLAVEQQASARDYEVLKMASKSTSKRARGKRDLGNLHATEFEPQRRQKRQFPLFKSKTLTNVLPAYGQHISQLPSVRALNTLTRVTNFTSVFLEAPLTLLTALQQQVYNVINFDFGLATELKNSLEVQSDPILNRMLILNENGVTCEDVCQHGNSVATIGICTNQYCTCFFKSQEFTRRFCPSDTVFDPLENKCARPEEAILCSDDDVPTPSIA